MRIYTFQSPNILQLQTKKMSCSQEYWDKDMRIYYDWMYEQYQKRIGSNKKSLIWVWEDISSWYFEYDEAEDTYWDNKQEHRYRVLLTIDVPEERILWSDYNAWHCPLNDGTLLSELEMEQEEQGKVFDKMNGWERIFDFEWLKVNGWGDVMTKQGVIDVFDIVAIKDIKYYDSKYKKIIDKEKIIKLIK